MEAEPVTAPAGDGPASIRAGLLLRLLSALPGHGDEALAVVNGLFGDGLAEQGSSMALPMTLHSGTDAVAPDHDRLVEAFPHATGRIAVLVHGLMSTESAWDSPGDPHTTYGALLARDHGVAAMYLRYNTGRHISVNGRDLARLLHQLVASWPVPVDDITLIGHSMGGLVIRSACHYASTTRPWRDLVRCGRSWPSKTRRVVLIGVPNTGAPLEVFANLTSAAMWSLPIPVTRLVGLGLDARSAGIRDLRFGAITDDDWIEQDPDARQRPLLHPVRPLKNADYLIIASTVTADPGHPLSRIFGDTFVTAASASGAPRNTTEQGLFPGATIRILPKISHVALPHRAEVYAEIDRWWRETLTSTTRPDRTRRWPRLVEGRDSTSTEPAGAVRPY